MRFVLGTGAAVRVGPALLAIALQLAVLPTAGAVNPAGRKIVFKRDANVWTMSSDGSSAAQVLAAVSSPTLSTDGATIAYVGGNGDIWTATVAGGSATDSGQAGTAPAWSASAAIAFVDGSGKIETMTGSGSSWSATSTGVTGTAPSWSPDQTKIVYVNASSHVATMTSAGAGITDLGTGGTRPSFSPDGTKIVYAASPPGGGGSQIYLMNADGTGQTRLTNDTFTDTAPVWSPDGTKILFVSDRETQTRLYVMNPDGTNVTNISDSSITSGTPSDTVPSWGPSLAPHGTLAAPTPSSSLTDGTTLTAGAATWYGVQPTSFAYKWERCNSSGAACTAITGATGQQYTTASADIGSTIRVVVTGTNTDESLAAESAATGTVGATAPTNLTAPTIAGTFSVGSTLTAGTGSWSGSTPTYTYQWLTCTSSSSCGNVSGATASTYVIRTADVGLLLEVKVTAANSQGSATATSSQTAPVPNPAPANTAAPTLTGTGTVGSLLTATTGAWTGTAPISYAYQWQRCSASGASCADISGATLSSYTQAAADAGSTVRIEITATNSAGSATATSTAQLVAAVAPANTTLPYVTGLPTVGLTLSTTTGTWTGTTPLTYAYQWQRCDSAGVACTAISGAAQSTYTPASADVGSTITVAVTATNTAGSASASSLATTAVTSAGGSGGGSSSSGGSGNKTLAVGPKSMLRPQVIGAAKSGSILSATKGVWTGGRVLKYAYQWQRCTAAGKLCHPIAKATSVTYAIAAADRGARLRVMVTVRSGTGSSRVASPLSPVVPKAKTVPRKTAARSRPRTPIKAHAKALSRRARTRLG